MGDKTAQDVYRERAILSADLSARLYDADAGDRLLMLPDLNGVDLDCLKQLFQPRQDGDVNSKHHRDRLVQMGLAERWNGWNFITKAGVAVLDTLGMLKR